MDKGFASFLKRDGVKLAASAGAKGKGTSFSLPVSGGSLDPTMGKGSIDQAGTIAFRGAKGKVPLREITVKTKHAPLIAKVGGSQLKIATSAKLSSKREGFGSSFTAKALKLSAKLAATLLFDPTFVAKLDARFVSLNPIFPAEHAGPTFTFPIAIGGAIAPNGSEGTLTRPRSGGGRGSRPARGRAR